MIAMRVHFRAVTICSSLSTSEDLHYKAGAGGWKSALKDFESKCLHLSVPSFRMLEDDLKLSSDDEESEQVRFPSVLLSCP